MNNKFNTIIYKTKNYLNYQKFLKVVKEIMKTITIVLNVKCIELILITISNPTRNFSFRVCLLRKGLMKAFGL